MSLNKQSGLRPDVTDAQANDMAVFMIGSNLPRPITVQLEINNTQFAIEIDAGTAASIMPASVFFSSFSTSENDTVKQVDGRTSECSGQSQRGGKVRKSPPQKLMLVVVEGVEDHLFWP